MNDEQVAILASAALAQGMNAEPAWELAVEVAAEAPDLRTAFMSIAEQAAISANPRYA
jgi:hypothetical protein